MKKLSLIIILFLTVGLSYSQDFYEKGNISNDTVLIDEIQVSGSYTVVKETPFSFQNLTKKEIDLQNQGTEPAVILSNTPSINHYSDNGLDIGYTYFRLRGIDQTRINSSLNGVTLNEPEDQGIYYNNYGDFSNSLSSIQIIRGAGISKGGNSTYGGSINFSSPEFKDTLIQNISINLGSFNTFKLSGGIYSKDLFIMVSAAQSDGYRYNSGNEQYSIYYGLNQNHLKFYGFVGHQQNGMAWLGEPLDSIKVDPRYNSNTKDETDKFLYVHNQLNWSKYNFSITGFHTYLNGWYDTDIAHFDPSLSWGELMSRIALNSNWLGLNINYNIKLNQFNNNFGVNSYTYNRDHTGTYNNVEAYTNTGSKNEVSPYFKTEFKWKYITLYGDVQYRHNIFSYVGLVPFKTQTYDFINWSTGLSVRTGTYTNVYYGLGQTHREPTRSDLFMGNDDYDSTMYNHTIPESVIDQELGVRFKNNNLSIESNLYYMKFKNEIVLNGQYGPNSILLHQNVDNSYRTGIEFSIDYLMNNGLEFKTLGNLSHNKIKEENVSFNPVLTPEVLLTGDIKYNLDKIGYIGFVVKYNGKSYLDLSNELELPSYTVFNTYLGFKVYDLDIKWNINNIMNKLILTNGVANYGSPLYFVMARINGNVSIKYNF